MNSGHGITQTVSSAEAMELALRHFQSGQRPQAQDLCIRVLAADPENWRALQLRGVLAHLDGDQWLALTLLEKAVRLSPGEAQPRYNLGVVYGVLDRFGEATEQYRAALQLDPANRAALNNLGNAALEIERFGEARKAYESLLESDPDNARVRLSLAISLMNLSEYETAGDAYREAMRLGPQDARVHWEYAHFLLQQGSFADGWREYDWRFQAGRDSLVACYPFPFQRWNGEPLGGKTILLHGEQGLGDEIMFASVYEEIIAEAERCVIACQPHFAPLFATSFPKAEVRAQPRIGYDEWTREPADWIEQLGPVDYQIPAGSLPLHRRAAREQFPEHKGYLKADPDKARNFAARLRRDAGRSGVRIGLTWKANPAQNYGGFAQRRAVNKSLRTEELGAFAGLKNATLVSLQKPDETAIAQREETPLALLDYSAELKDFSDTAAIIANLDLARISHTDCRARLKRIGIGGAE